VEECSRKTPLEGRMPRQTFKKKLPGLGIKAKGKLGSVTPQRRGDLIQENLASGKGTSWQGGREYPSLIRRERETGGGKSPLLLTDARTHAPARNSYSSPVRGFQGYVVGEDFIKVMQAEGYAALSKSLGGGD